MAATAPRRPPKRRTKKPPQWANFAELHARIGKPPLRRILMDPPPGTATEKDVLRFLEAADKRLCELVDGVLLEKTMGWSEAMLAAQVIIAIGFHLKEDDRGLVVGADGAVKLFPGLIRIPDVALYLWERFPGRKMPKEPLPQLYPDLAVEVLSESNTKAEMRRKLRDYFRSGVRLVWIIDPRTFSVAVHSAADACEVLGMGDTLLGDPVLPGFKLKVKDLFSRLEPRR